MKELRLFWWQSASGVKNLGDELTALIMKNYFDVSVEHSAVSDADAIGAGSILDAVYSPKLRDPNGPPIAIIGSGLMHPVGNFRTREYHNVYGVRGYLTKTSLYSDEPIEVGVGDPGLLAGLTYQQSKSPKYDIGLIPHVSYSNDERIRDRFQDLRNATIIDIRTDDVDSFMSKLADCRYVLSQSLHGLILADSIGVPNTWLNDFPLNSRGGNFKFYDYFSSINRPFDSVLSASDVVTNQTVTDKSFQSDAAVINRRQKDIVAYTTSFLRDKFGANYSPPKSTLQLLERPLRAKTTDPRSARFMTHSPATAAPLLDIVTVTMGREFYLAKALDALLGQKTRNFHHYLVLNACTASPEILERARALGSTVLVSREPMVIGAALNFVKPHLTAPYVMKMDDDAIMIGDDFTEKVADLIPLIPEAIFSPYPVGLIGNPGGPSSKQHTAVYSDKTDTYYSLRKVGHVGGFARISPTRIYREIDFVENDHTEDTEFSAFARANKIPMYYLENALIMEHAESTIGQGRRDESYFKRTRNWYKDTPQD